MLDTGVDGIPSDFPVLSVKQSICIGVRYCYALAIYQIVPVTGTLPRSSLLSIRRSSEGGHGRHPAHNFCQASSRNMEPLLHIA